MENDLSRPTRARGLKLVEIPYQVRKFLRSRPTRARGLKLALFVPWLTDGSVAPHAGAWIETGLEGLLRSTLIPVAPHAGAWIETHASGSPFADVPVAPHAGAWIETPFSRTAAAFFSGRAPRGRVD